MKTKSEILGQAANAILQLDALRETLSALAADGLPGAAEARLDMLLAVDHLTYAVNWMNDLPMRVRA